MQLQITLSHQLPELLTSVEEIDTQEWEDANADERNDIVAGIMDMMVRKLLEEKLVRLHSVQVDGVEYDEE